MECKGVRIPMPTEITMPKLSDTMEEGTILKWRIKEGDKVAKGNIIAEVETDKATMEMEAFEVGVVTALKVDEGETVPVGTVIAILEGEGGKAGKAAEEEPAEKPVKAAEEEETEEEETEEEEAEEEEAEEEGGKQGRASAASPAARKLAQERGVNLADIRGSGPGGRVVLADVERTQPTSGTDAEESGGKPQKRSVKIRRLVARKMVDSWQNIPHFFVTVAVDMTDVIRFRRDIGVSINDFIVAAAASSLKEHPWVNSHWIDGEAVEKESIDISLAVATDRGLYNPVIKDCGNLPLKELSLRAKDLADRAHKGKLREEDMSEGTFTISNMGMLGVESFSAIITPPQAAVLAVGTVKGEIVINEKEEPGIAPVVRLTLSADHRILDGADAAEFLATMKTYLEAPVTLITCDDVNKKR
jgi:pyruvate dehydrogenase E2 component (dihydrolipoamide acetyltransferase)